MLLLRSSPITLGYRNVSERIVYVPIYTVDWCLSIKNTSVAEIPDGERKVCHKRAFESFTAKPVRKSRGPWRHRLQLEAEEWVSG